jgi:hypothetical protein
MLRHIVDSFYGQWVSGSSHLGDAQEKRDRPLGDRGSNLGDLPSLGFNGPPLSSSVEERNQVEDKVWRILPWPYLDRGIHL